MQPTGARFEALTCSRFGNPTFELADPISVQPFDFLARGPSSAGGCGDPLCNMGCTDPFAVKSLKISLPAASGGA